MCSALGASVRPGRTETLQLCWGPRGSEQNSARMPGPSSARSPAYSPRLSRPATQSRGPFSCSPMAGPAPPHLHPPSPLPQSSRLPMRCLSLPHPRSTPPPRRTGGWISRCPGLLCAALFTAMEVRYLDIEGERKNNSHPQAANLDLPFLMSPPRPSSLITGWLPLFPTVWN